MTAPTRTERSERPDERGRRPRWAIPIDPRSPAVRRIATVLFAVYLLVLAGVAFLPLPGTPPPGAAGSGPAYELALSRPDLLGGWEAERNVLMTVPFGLLLPLVVRWRHELLLLACVALPLLVETGQLVGSVLVGWAWRSFDVNDLFTNTVGGLLGLALTGAALVLTARPGRLPVQRLVPGALAAGLLVWAGLSTATTPAYVPAVDACSQTPVGAVTSLPGGESAYAASDGSLCLRGTLSGSVPADADPGVVVSVVEEDGGGLEVGVAGPGTENATDGRGNPVRTHPVAGSDLLVWVAPLP